MGDDVFLNMLQTARELRRRRLQRLARLAGLTGPSPSRSRASAASNEVDVRRIRAVTGLSQAKFAELLSIEVSTLRNWEQRRREPTGPARALLRAISNDPVAVIRALTD